MTRHRRVPSRPVSASDGVDPVVGQADHLGEARREQYGIGHGHEVEPPDTIGMAIGALHAQPMREARLAATAGPHDRDEAFDVEQRVELGELRDATDKAVRVVSGGWSV